LREVVTFNYNSVSLHDCHVAKLISATIWILY